MASSTLSPRVEELLDVMIEATQERKRRERMKQQRRKREAEDLPLDDS